MKTFLETCAIAASIAFVAWLIITAGMRFEIKIQGKEYGFSVGGPDQLERRELFIKRYYWSTAGGAIEKNIMFTAKELSGITPRVFEDMLRNHAGNLMSCEIYYEGKYPEPRVLFNLILTKYPEIPDYTPLPYTVIKTIYTVKKGEDVISWKYSQL